MGTGLERFRGGSVDEVSTTVALGMPLTFGGGRVLATAGHGL